MEQRRLKDFSLSIRDDAWKAVTHTSKEYTNYTVGVLAHESLRRALGCLPLCGIAKEYYNTKRGAFAHRCAAIAVWGAFRRWRLHHNVGHITGVISALVDQLKRQEVELNGVQKSWLNVDLLLVFCFFLILCIFFFLCLSAAKLCSGGRYLAVLRQEHGLGMTEGLPDIMLGIRVVAAGDRVAQRHHVQGVGGEGALHALHGE